METAAASAQGWRESLFALGRDGAVVGVAGLLTGVIVAGIGGRLLMRVAAAAAPIAATGAITEAGNTVGDITIAGTLAFIFGIGIFSGVMGGAALLHRGSVAAIRRVARLVVRRRATAGGERSVRHA
jgi:hypothetical protein